MKGRIYQLAKSFPLFFVGYLTDLLLLFHALSTILNKIEKLTWNKLCICLWFRVAPKQNSVSFGESVMLGLWLVYNLAMFSSAAEKKKRWKTKRKCEPVRVSRETVKCVYCLHGMEMMLGTSNLQFPCFGEHDWNCKCYKSEFKSLFACLFGSRPYSGLILWMITV